MLMVIGRRDRYRHDASKTVSNLGSAKPRIRPESRVDWMRRFASQCNELFDDATGGNEERIRGVPQHVK